MKQLLQRMLWVACLFVLLVPAVADAFGGPVTSGFGYRWHPIHNDWLKHNGIDIGLDEGTVIPAPFSGYVEVGSQGIVGHGNWLTITNNSNQTVIFGHLNGYIVSSGYVQQGQPVAISGNTGGSTAPHLHVGWFPNGYATPEDDYSENPDGMLRAAGWNLEGDTSGNIIDLNAAGEAIKSFFGYPLEKLKQYLKEALDVPLGVNFDYLFNLGKSLRTVMEKVVDGCLSAMQAIIQVSLPLLGVLAVIDLTMFIWRGPAITGSLETSFWTGIVQRIVKYGFITFLITSWQMVVNKVFIGTAKWSFVTFSPQTAGAIADVTAPDIQLRHFMSLLNPSSEWLGSLTVTGMMDHIGLFILNMILVYGSFILFVILIISVIIMYIEFYMSAVFSAFTIPFASLTPTTFIPEGMVSHLISSTIRLMAVGLVFSIMKNEMDIFAYDPTSVFGILAVLLFVITVTVVGMLLPNRIADGLQVSAKL